jgi:5-methylcytosine-specific restriction endonuclease McrA
MQLAMLLTYLGRPSPYLGPERYHEYLRSEAWRRKRERVLARDDRVCTRCGSEHNLHVHHLSYRFIGRERLSDLVTLCEVCHRREHGL